MTPVNAQADGVLLERLRLRLDTVNRLDQHCTHVRRRIGQDDQANAIAFPPKNIGAVRDVGCQRRQQHTVKCLLRDSLLFGSRLRMTAHRHISQSRNISVEVVHANALCEESELRTAQARQGDRERSASSDTVTCRRYLASVKLHQVLDDRQS